MPISKYPNPPNGPYSVPYKTPDYFYDNTAVIQPYWLGVKKDTTCTGNLCPWFGVECPENGPFLLDGEKFICGAFTDPDDPKPPTGAYNPPVTGGTITAEHINALRDSILEEYGNRRWILESQLRQDVVDFEETLGTVINTPNLEAIGDFIQYIIDRGDSNIQAEAYDFVTDGGYNNYPSGFNDSNGETIPTAPTSGTQVDASDIRALMEIVDNLRKACVCNDNCVCFGKCDCNWNCGSNYSDITLKEDIQEIAGRDMINNMDAKAWKYTGVDGTHFSLMAQDVKRCLEGMGYRDQKVVEEDENGKLMITRPYELMAFLWDNVQDLNKSFEELNRKVDELTK